MAETNGHSMNRLLILAVICGSSIAIVEGPRSASEESPSLKTDYGDVAIFPADNPWNQDVSKLPVHPLWAKYLESVGLAKPLHPDFGTVWEGAPNGIPYVAVPGDQPKVRVQFEYADESDAGPYPIPENPPIEGGPNAPLDSDRHMLIIDPQHKKLYELFGVVSLPGGKWKAGSGAIFDLASNKLRPEGWTSADAAGLPIFPGLARYDEIVERGELRACTAIHRPQDATGLHFPGDALRQPVQRSESAADGATRPAQVRLRPLQVSQVGPGDSAWAEVLRHVARRQRRRLVPRRRPDPRWSDDELGTLKRVKVGDFEALDTGPLKK